MKTADNVDEPRNRRVDYVISDGPPSYSASFQAQLEANPRPRARSLSLRGGCEG